MAQPNNATYHFSHSWSEFSKRPSDQYLLSANTKKNEHLDFVTKTEAGIYYFLHA